MGWVRSYTRGVAEACAQVRLPVIVGPTAGGKSGLAVRLALEFERLGLGRGEIVSCDSVQVYRGLDIGSAKPTRAEQRGVVHHLIDLIEPTERFSVSDWLTRAEAAIQEIRDREKIPIVVGGTHLYVKAFLEGLFEGPDPDPGLRAELEAMDPIERRAELERVDPEAAERIHRNDHRRTIRAIEIHRLTGRPISALQTQWDTGIARRDCVLVGLDWPTEAINRRINARVGTMIERGLVAEARRLWEADRLGPTARDALGYKQLSAHFRGECTLEEAIERIKVETRRFGKNQRTWLRRLRRTPGSVWIEACAEPSAGWVDIVLDGLGLVGNADG